jgi:hypothetical protein
MATGWLEQGRVKGMREVLRKQLDKKFGPLGPDVLQRIDDLPDEKLEETLLLFVDAKSLDELGLGTGGPEGGN